MKAIIKTDYHPELNDADDQVMVEALEYVRHRSTLAAFYRATGHTVDARVQGDIVCGRK